MPLTIAVKKKIATIGERLDESVVMIKKLEGSDKKSIDKVVTCLEKAIKMNKSIDTQNTKKEQGPPRKLNKYILWSNENRARITAELVEKHGKPVTVQIVAKETALQYKKANKIKGGEVDEGCEECA